MVNCNLETCWENVLFTFLGPFIFKREKCVAFLFDESKK